MAEPVDAVKAFLSVTYPIWTDYAATTSGQYLILAMPPWGTPDEQPTGGAGRGAAGDLRVKAVTGTTDGVRTMLRQIRDQLSPNSGPALIPFAGYALQTIFTRSEFVDVDQSITLTQTGRHPAFGVDTYRFTCDPV